MKEWMSKDEAKARNIIYLITFSALSCHLHHQFQAQLFRETPTECRENKFELLFWTRWRTLALQATEEVGRECMSVWR